MKFCVHPRVQSPVGEEADGAFELVAGFRRVAAAEAASLDHIPAVVRDPVAGVQRISDQLAENDDRCALTALDVAGAMQQMLDLGATTDAVAQRFPTSTDTIDRWRAVLALPAPLLTLVRDGTIDVSDVADLGELADDEEFVAAVVAEVRAGTSPRWAVSRVRQQRALAATVATSQAKLEKEGCPIVAAPRYDTVTGNSRMQRLGDGVKVSLREHRKQPCHAAFISSRGEVAYVCTDRSRHAGEAGRGVLDLKAERAAKRAVVKELREAQPLRAEALKDALANSAIGTDEAVRHILSTAVWDARAEELEDACALLDLAMPEGGWGVSRPLGGPRRRQRGSVWISAGPSSMTTRCNTGAWPHEACHSACSDRQRRRGPRTRARATKAASACGALVSGPISPRNR